MRSKGLIVLLAAAAVVVAVVLLWPSPRPEPHDLPQPPVESPAKDLSPVPVVNNPSAAATPDPVEQADAWTLELTIEELLDGLRKAADNRDSAAIARIRALLLARDLAEVARHCAMRLDFLDSPEGDGQRQAPGYVPYLGNLAYLLATGDVEPVLARLRAQWSEPVLSQSGNLKKWEQFDVSRAQEPAFRCLPRLDAVLADAIGAAMLDGLTDARGHRTAAHAARLGDLYREGLPEGERPDPWQSLIVETIATRRDRLTPKAWGYCRDMLVLWRDAAGISQRLREQIGKLLVVAPGSFWELAEAVQGAGSPGEAGLALGEYLRQRHLSPQEVEYLMEAIKQRFEGRNNAPIELAQAALPTRPDQRDDALMDGVRGFARSVVDASLATDDVRLSRVGQELLSGFWRNWRPSLSRSPAIPRDLKPLLDYSSVEKLMAMFDKHWDGTVKSFERTSGRTLAVVINLLWLTDSDLKTQFDAAGRILGKLDTEYWQAGMPVLNGLLLHGARLQEDNERLDSATVDSLAIMLNKLMPFIERGPQPKRPIDGSSFWPLLTRAIGEMLEIAGDPPLNEAAVKILLRMASVVAEDGDQLVAGTKDTSVKREAERGIRAARRLMEVYGE